MEWNMRPMLFGLVCSLVLLSSCSKQIATSTNEIPPASQSETAGYSNVRFDSDSDLVCGMPLTAGVGDTAHYADKVFGFCSKTCKEKFAKNPTKYLAAK